jgi:hypothetical protein
MTLGPVDWARFKASPVDLLLEQLFVEAGRYADVAADFQLRFFEAAFALDPAGLPLYDLVYEERRRGEAKTADAAAVLVADLLTAPPRSQFHVVAGDLDQAGLVRRAIQDLEARSPILEGALDIQSAIIINRATGSTIHILASDSRTSLGISPRRVVFDELSLQVDSRLWEAMYSATAKSKFSQMISLSMAGSDFSSIGRQVYELAKSTPEFYFASRAGSELAPWLSVKKYEQMRKNLHPTVFKRYFECEWVEAAGSFISADLYDAAVTGHQVFAGDGTYRRVGYVDLGISHDITAGAIMHGEGDRVVLDHLFTLQGTKAAHVNLPALEESLVAKTEQFNVGEWKLEAYQAEMLAQRLQTRLPGVKVTTISPTASSQRTLFEGFYSLLATNRLVLYRHDLLRRQALNLQMSDAGYGLLKVSGTSAVHQDTVICVGGAALMVAQGPKARPVEGWASGFSSVNRGLAGGSSWSGAGSGGGDYDPRGGHQPGDNAAAEERARIRREENSRY